MVFCIYFCGINLKPFCMCINVAFCNTEQRNGRKHLDCSKFKYNHQVFRKIFLESSDVVRKNYGLRERFVVFFAFGKFKLQAFWLQHIWLCIGARTERFWMWVSLFWTNPLLFGALVGILCVCLSTNIIYSNMIFRSVFSCLIQLATSTHYS